MMSYRSTVHITDLEPGPHQVMVTLSRNDHMDYSLDGELIMGMAMFTVPGEVAAPDASFHVMYMDGSVSGVDSPAVVSYGDIVEITVQSDVAEQVHIHGYDLLLALEAGQAQTPPVHCRHPGGLRHRTREQWRRPTIRVRGGLIPARIDNSRVEDPDARGKRSEC